MIHKSGGRMSWYAGTHKVKDLFRLKFAPIDMSSGSNPYSMR